MKSWINRLVFENPVVRWFKYLNTWTAHRDTIKQLHALDDRELKDIGFTRGEIDTLIFRKDTE
jgi:uncharacterized protein YjiS (DUF1127 family)